MDRFIAIEKETYARRRRVNSSHQKDPIKQKNNTYAIICFIFDLFISSGRNLSLSRAPGFIRISLSKRSANINV